MPDRAIDVRKVTYKTAVKRYLNKPMGKKRRLRKKWALNSWQNIVENHLTQLAGAGSPHETPAAENPGQILLVRAIDHEIFCQILQKAGPGGAQATRRQMLGIVRHFAIWAVEKYRLPPDWATFWQNYSAQPRSTRKKKKKRK